MPPPSPRRRRNPTVRWKASCESSNRIPQLNGLWKERVPFVEGVHQTHSHHLTKHSVKIVRDLRREKRAVLARKRSAGLEKIGHVQGASRSIPGRRADSVVPNGVENVDASLTLLKQLLRRGWAVEHLRLIRRLAGQAPQLLTRGVPQSVVQPPGVEPVSSFLG